MPVKAKITNYGDSEARLNLFLAEFDPEKIIAITQHGDQITVFYKD